jgi:hypothetical protein
MSCTAVTQGKKKKSLGNTRNISRKNNPKENTPQWQIMLHWPVAGSTNRSPGGWSSIEAAKDREEEGDGLSRKAGFEPEIPRIGAGDGESMRSNKGGLPQVV